MDSGIKKTGNNQTSFFIQFNAKEREVSDVVHINSLMFAFSSR